LPLVLFEQLTLTKLGGSLHVDLADDNGVVVVKRLKEMADGLPHPALLAVPQPLDAGDRIVMVNGEAYANFKECVAKIRASPDVISFVVERTSA
jgi:hypothetical protein